MTSSKTLLPFLIFMVTYVLSVYFRHKELFVLLIMSAAFIATSIGFGYHTATEALVLLMYGGLMTMVEFSCVFFFDMWRYNFVNWSVPLWLPVGWSLMGMLLLHIIRALSALGLTL